MLLNYNLNFARYPSEVKMGILTSLIAFSVKKLQCLLPSRRAEDRCVGRKKHERINPKYQWERNHGEIRHGEEAAAGMEQYTAHPREGITNQNINWWMCFFTGKNRSVNSNTSNHAERCCWHRLPYWQNQPLLWQGQQPRASSHQPPRCRASP